MSEKASAAIHEPVAIIGIAGIFPGSRTVAEFFNNVLRKRCFVRHVPDWLWEDAVFFDKDRKAPLKTYTRIGALLGEIQLDFSPFRIPPAVVAQMSWNQKLALVCTREALEDAGYLKKEFDHERAGVILAAGTGELRDITVETLLVRLIRARFDTLVRNPDDKRIIDALWKEYESVYPSRIITEDTRAGESGNIVSGRIAAVFDLHGPNLVLDSACASSLAAVSTAVNALQTGMCDMVITGGVDTDMSLTSCIGLAKASALSASGSFPFDSRADGFVLGEGCGIFILKRFNDAVRDNDRMYALIRGCGGSSDGAGKSIMAPSSEGQLRALRRAYENAGLPPSVLHFLECHGTGTQVGDATELESVSRLLAETDYGPRSNAVLPVGSSKAMVGHLKMAAGAAGLLRSILAINSHVVPPQVNFETPNPAFDWGHGRLRIPKSPEPIDADEVFAGVSGFGFGGTNYHVVLSTAPGNARKPVTDIQEFIFPEIPPLSNDIAFLFPGQGSQYVGMLEELRNDPASQDFLSRADEVVTGISGRGISPSIYPPAAQEESEPRDALELALRDAEIAQPAIFTVSAILLNQVRRLGIVPGMVMGHSLGEYTAIYAAGILSFEDALQAVAKRGFLMGELAKATPGAMAFVNAGPEKIDELIGKSRGYIVYANFNSYEQTVVSGDAAAIDKLVEHATSCGLQSRRLNVNGAFHSRLMSPCVPAFHAFLEKFPFHATAVPLSANQSRQVYPFITDIKNVSRPMPENDRCRTIDLMCRQIDHPVDFVRQIELAYEAGVRRFVEVGPKNVLSGLVNDILQGKPFQVLYLDFNVNKRLSTLCDDLQRPLTIGRRPLSLKPRFVPRVKMEMSHVGTSQSIPDLVRHVVAQVSGYEVSRIGDHDEFERDMGIDTLKIFEIITRLRGKVLPETFNNFRQATSIRKILDLAGEMITGQRPVSNAMPESGHLRTLSCFRYQNVVAGSIDSVPPVPSARHYRVIAGPNAEDAARHITDSPQFGHEENGDTLILWRLPYSPEEFCRQTVPELLRLVIGIADSEMRKPGIYEVHLVTFAPPEEFNCAFFRSISGLMKSFQKDLSYLKFSYTHLDTMKPDVGLLQRLLAEPVLGRHVAADGLMREGRLVRMPESPNNLNELSELLGPEDVVLVTGGTGGIAASIVRNLLPLVRSRFVLIGRKSRTERWIKDEGQGRVEYLIADLCDSTAVKTLRLYQRRVTLLIHAAGIGAARPVREIKHSELSQVLDVKILGLKRVLEELDVSRLRGIVSFSSIAGFFGGDGHPDYAAANGYLDGFVHASVPVLTIGWSAWGEVGMATDEATRRFLEIARIEPISVREGVGIFSALLKNFLKESLSGTCNILVRKDMGNGFFLPHDPLSAGMIEMESEPSATSRRADAMFSDDEPQVFDADLEDARVALPIGKFFDEGEVIVLKTLPAARYSIIRSDSLFTPAEQEEIAAVAAEKRRQEKRAGKLAVKVLMRNVIKSSYRFEYELSDFQVLSSHPPVKVEMPGDPQMNGILAKMHFSISHGDGLVCAAASRMKVGIDIEKIRTLPVETEQAICGESLLADIEGYVQNVQNYGGLPMGEKEYLPVAVFTQKEAVLKAVGIGLGEGLAGVTLERIGIGTPVTATHRGKRYRVLSIVIDGYVLSVASLLDGASEQRILENVPFKIVPLSIGQEGILFQEQLSGIGSTYNIGWSLRLQGPLDVRALVRSLQHIVDRHEALRTVFHIENGFYEARVFASMPISMPIVEYDNMPLEDALEEVSQLCKEGVRQSFDLSRGPLIKAKLFRLKDRDHVLLFIFHHTIIDAFSEWTFRKDLSACYQAYTEGQEPQLAPIPFQYSDFSIRQRERLTPERLEQLVTYWRHKLDGIPDLLDLPVDHGRPSVQTYRSGNVPFNIPGALIQRLQNLSRNEGVTLFTTFLTAFNVMLMRLSGQDDIVVGAPFLGREETDTLPVMGYYVNILPLRTNLSGDPRVRDILPVVRETVMEALGHQELPFQKLVEALSPRRSAAYSPIFQVALRFLQETVLDVSLKGLDQKFEEIPACETAYALTLIVGVGKADGRGRFEYNRDLFTQDTIELFAERLLHILESIAENPGQRLSEIPLMSPAEEFKVLRSWNATYRPVPLCGIDALFTAQAEKTPDAVALVHGEKQITYRELNARANQLAHYLRELGVHRETLVGLCMERSIDVIICLLGIVKSGGAYLPLDPDYPMERLSFMLEDARPFLVLTHNAQRRTLPDSDAEIICVDRIREEISRESEENPVSETRPDDLVYIMYTSGSTGKPKGVEICHRGIVRLLFGVEYAELNSSQSFLHMAPLSFDASTFEIWGPLLHGGRCVLFPERIPSLDTLGDVLSKKNINTLWLTASLFNTVIDEAPGILSGIRQLLIGGEVLSVPHVNRALGILPSAQIINCYGPTESTTFACCYRIPGQPDRAASSIPIGGPIANTEVYVLDSHLKPLPIGIPGELHIGGAGLARGYLNRKDLTSEKFVSNPFSEDAGSHLYRTGDRVRYRCDGRLEFLGRLDYQVKIRGYRVEPEEIEARLRRHPDIQDAMVVAHKDKRDISRLCAFFVSRAGTYLTSVDIKQFLRQGLPEYMLPSEYVALEAFPRTPGGKIDRHALFSMAQLQRAGQVSVVSRFQPVDTIEKDLIRIWEEVLDVHPIGRDISFFDLGGNSLMSIKLCSRIGKEYRTRLSPSVLFQSPTIAQLAAHIRSMPTHPPFLSLVSLKPGGVLPPLFCLPDITGTSLVFRHLAPHMAPEQSVYSIDGSEEILEASLEETALMYINETRKIVPDGPFQFLGFSSGGIMAFEMARQLHAMNLEVSFLGMLDTFCPADLNKKLNVFGFDTVWRSFINLPFWLYYCAPFWAAHYAKQMLHGGVASDTNVHKVIEWLQHYTPGYYAGRVVFFRSRAQAILPATAHASWSRLAERVDVHTVPGHHMSILKGTAVSALAKHITLELSGSAL